jgi:hypothetical protein
MDHVLMHGSKEVKRLIIAVFAGNLYGVYEPGRVLIRDAL